jgi:CRISPR-associated protein Csd2
MALERRYDFVVLFDVQDGNPNGDPDADNLPRIDGETGEGLVTDVCIKRKIRNYIQLTKSGEAGFDIFIKEKAVLNRFIDAACAEAAEKIGNSKALKGDVTEAARGIMCKRYYDVRTFGAVMSTGKNAGQVRGPVQLTFARSVEPIVSSGHSITRMAVATEAEAERQSGDNRTMGRKYTIPYGLYCLHGFVSASLAEQTGFNDEDLDLFWEALLAMFDDDRSAARGLMSTRRLIIFEHESKLGNASATDLFERIQVRRVKSETGMPARRFADYEVLLDEKPVVDLKTVIRIA